MNEQELLRAQGKYLKTSNLIEQAGYTIRIAREDLKEFADTGITEETLNSADSLLKQLVEMSGKHETGKDDLPLSTEDVMDKLTEAKDWVKKTKLKAKRAFRQNKTVLDDFFSVPRTGKSVPNTIAAMTKLIELNKKYDTELKSHGGGNNFAAIGKSLLTELQDTDSLQEKVKKDLPESTLELYYARGVLYNKLKDINDAALEAFMKDRVKAAQYNMEILNRGGSKRKDESEEAVGAVS